MESREALALVEHLDEKSTLLDNEIDIPPDAATTLLEVRKKALRITLANREAVGEILSDIDSGTDQDDTYTFFVEDEVRSVPC